MIVETITPFRLSKRREASRPARADTDAALADECGSRRKKREVGR